MTNRIQSLPESVRKIILWSLLVIVGVSLFIFYAKDARKKLAGINLNDELKKIPKIELPKIEWPIK